MASSRMSTSRRRFLLGLGIAILSTAGALAIPPIRRRIHPIVVALRGKQTVEDRVREFAAADQRVRAACAERGISFPPQRVVLLGLKSERRLEVYAGPSDAELRFALSFPIQAASGALGPKLREGDRQVPEGVYLLESLNPNSRFHAALRVGYPNQLDIASANRKARDKLGGDIMIHGGAVSVGCLAMGDPVIEDLFVLCAAVGIENVTIVLSPVDLRVTNLPIELQSVDAERYTAVRSIMSRLNR